MLRVHITQQKQETPKKKHLPACIRSCLDPILIVIIDSEIESEF